MIRYQRDSRLLVLDDLVDPKVLSIEDLKRAVIRTNRLESNWSNWKGRNAPTIKPVGTIRTTKVSRSSVNFEDFEELSSFYISNDFLVIPTYNGRLIIFDLVNSRMIESYKLRNWSGGITIRLHHASRTLYGIIGKFWETNILSERYVHLWRNNVLCSHGFAELASV